MFLFSIVCSAVTSAFWTVSFHLQRSRIKSTSRRLHASSIVETASHGIHMRCQRKLPIQCRSIFALPTYPCGPAAF